MSTQWLRYNFWIQKDLKDQLENTSLRLHQSQAEIVRTALIEYLKFVVEKPEEIVAIEIAARKRTERLKMVKPKDGHDARMLPVQVFDVIAKERRELERAGLLTASDFDCFIELVEENKEAAQDNPKREWIVEKLDLLITKLKEEQTKYRR